MLALIHNDLRIAPSCTNLYHSTSSVELEFKSALKLESGRKLGLGFELNP